MNVEMAAKAFGHIWTSMTSEERKPYHMEYFQVSECTCCINSHSSPLAVFLDAWLYIDVPCVLDQILLSCQGQCHF